MSAVGTVITAMFAKADRKLNSARHCFSLGDWEQTASCAYYAAFHSVSALLESRGLTYSSHRQTIGAFNRDFVASGLFPRDFGRRLSELFEDRQSGDYELEVLLSEEMARNDLAFASELMLSCRVHLGLPPTPSKDESTD